MGAGRAPSGGGGPGCANGMERGKKRGFTVGEAPLPGNITQRKEGQRFEHAEKKGGVL